MGIKKKLRFLSNIIISSLLLIVCSINTAKALTIPNKDITTNNINFVGTWYMQTIVTESNCPHILVGTTTESTVQITPLLNLLWQGGEWDKAQSTLKLLNENEAIAERSTELKTNDDNTWKAILVDHLNITEQNTIHSESIVEQYKNGIRIGKYKTFSILTKSND